jgi:hypothetical protein
MAFDDRDKIYKRVAYFERFRQSDKDIIRQLPFYEVNYPNLAGKMFEPVDAMPRRDDGNGATYSSVAAYKDVNELTEFIPRQKMTYAEDGLKEGEDTNLHSFGWDWPRT